MSMTFSWRNPGSVPVELAAGAARVVEVRVGRQTHHGIVRLVRDENPDVDAAKPGKLQGVGHGLVGNEVGARDPDPLSRRVDGVDVHQVRGLERVRRTRGQDQHGSVSGSRGDRSPSEVEPASGRPVPVLRERKLRPQRGRPLDPDVGVPPGTDLGVAGEVLVADVEAADPRHLPVDHHDLAMVPEIELEPVARALSGMELVNFDPRGAELVDVGARQIVAADLVVEEAHPDPGLGPLDQVGLELAADAVVVDDVVLDQDVLPGRIDALRGCS